VGHEKKSRMTNRLLLPLLLATLVACDQGNTVDGLDGGSGNLGDNRDGTTDATEAGALGDVNVADTAAQGDTGAPADTGPGSDATDTDGGGDGAKPGCVDEDEDGYGEGTECLGPDCDDANPDAHPGLEADPCDGADNDCDDSTDEDFVAEACGVGACASESRCDGGEIIDCVPKDPEPDDATCDGEDDNCNGEVDEDYVAEGCGVGACASESACAEGVEAPCEPGAPAADDATCDEIDDDCDGEVDDDFPVEHCGEGACAAQSRCAVGEILVCVPGERADRDATCDGFDDDCDGETDEDYAPEGCGVGACASESTCIDGVEEACEAGDPVGDDDATCDAIDDNCNGETDEDYAPQQCGEGACLAESRCVNGEELDCEPFEPGERIDATCDDVDDDCDGRLDEDYAPVGCGDGVCAAESACEGGAEVACEPGDALSADDATCDGVDDDCSGENDEDYLAAACGVGACASISHCTDGVEEACAPRQALSDVDVTCDGVDDNCNGETDEDYAPDDCGVGACAAVSACAAGVELACEPGDRLADDDATCDGVDDDCDGLVDEDYVPEDCGVGACASESACVNGVVEACAEGQPLSDDDATCDGVDDNCDGAADEDYAPVGCGVGACAAESACADGVEQACQPAAGAADDATCDGVDDDCSGEADEDYVPVGCGVGACASQTACVAGAVEACVEGQPLSDTDATCDGIDDDCSGEADEEYAPEGCGVGACAAQSTCEGGVEQACQPGAAAADDVTCDGIDDDCNGEADEDYLPVGCGDGVCAAESACAAGVEQACQPGQPEAADDATCDGVDQDCSGEADEDFVGDGCGVGACAAQAQCQDGQVVACQPGQPAANDATCDGVDDNCNGLADEDYQPEGCGDGVCASESACEGGVELACEPGQRNAQDDANCDAIDDDCSGEADEDYAPVDCGVGACASQSACDGGQEQVCVAGQPLSEDDATCDGVDDDCDGDVDEDCLQNLLRFEVADAPNGGLDVRVVYRQTVPQGVDPLPLRPELIDLQFDFDAALSLPAAPGDAVTRGQALVDSEKNMTLFRPGANSARLLILAFANSNKIGPGVIAVFHFDRQGGGPFQMVWDVDRTHFAPQPADVILERENADLNID